MKTEDTIFLLGGQDLEMQEIAKMLEKQGLRFHDKKLTWATATLSQYKEELEKYKGTSCHIYGVELRKDMEIPYPYTTIDHHNENSSHKSSLEQVAELLQVELTRHQKLVAANDSAYINGLRALKATSEEIENIRQLDRKAQGVTEEQEQDADQAIEAARKFDAPQFWVIESRHPNFSPICDRLSDVQNYLIHTDNEWTFYGHMRNLVKEFIFNKEKEKKEERKEKKEKENFYWGGTENGYIGRSVGSLPAEEMKKEIDEIIALVSNAIYSTHTFYFPFTWEDKDLAQWKRCKESRHWERNLSVQEEDSEESKSLYNETNFFYKFIHPILYDFPNHKKTSKERIYSHILHLERKEPKTQACTYGITVNEKTYRLDLKHLNLNFYRTGVGTLSFFLENRRYADSDDILNINQYGRRIFPPFYEDVHAEKRAQLADRIEITGLHGITPENFRSYTCRDTWKPAPFIEQLIHDYHPDIRIEPVVDDRMFVTCWYQNALFSRQLQDSPDYTRSEEWFRYLFVDTQHASCQDDRMMAGLLEQATDPRWRKYGTMYGITPYSFMVLTDVGDFGMNKIRNDVNTIYSRMVELVLMQRASILKFTKDVGAINLWEKRPEKEKQKELHIGISNIYRDYVFFINQMYYLDVTAQEQGSELYHILHKQLDLERQAKDLDDEIGELHNYISVINDQMNAKRDSFLNLLGGIFLPASIIVGLFGMNKFCDLEDFWVEFIIVLVTTVILISLFYLTGWIQISFLQHKKKK